MQVGGRRWFGGDVGASSVNRSDDLTLDMRSALNLVAVGQSPFIGTSGSRRRARGGTMAALVRRGLVSRCPLGLYWLTDAGKARAGLPQ